MNPLIGLIFPPCHSREYGRRTHHVLIMKENLIKCGIKFENCDDLYKKIPSNGRELLGLVCTGEGNRTKCLIKHPVTGGSYRKRSTRGREPCSANLDTRQREGSAGWTCAGEGTAQSTLNKHPAVGGNCRISLHGGGNRARKLHAHYKIIYSAANG